MITETPVSLLSYFRINTKERKVKTTATIYTRTSVKLRNFYLYKYSKIYNRLDPSIKSKSIIYFKKEIMMMIKAGTISNTMD